MRSKKVASREASAPAGDRDAKRAALEAQLGDDAAWPVLEDFLLETDDPRAAIILAERAGDAQAAAAARKRISKRLFGPSAVMLQNRVRYVTTWRAGYVREASYQLPKSIDVAKEEALFAELFTTPAMAALRSFSFVAKRPVLLAPFVELLGRAPCAALLRRVSLGYSLSYNESKEVDHSRFDLGLLADTAIDELEVRFSAVPRPAPWLRRVRRLGFSWQEAGPIRPVLASVTWSALRELELPMDAALAILPMILDGASTPVLETLVIHDDYNKVTANVLRILAPSQLLRGLRTLRLAPGAIYPNPQTERDVPGAALGPAFAHLTLATVPMGHVV